MRPPVRTRDLNLPHRVTTFVRLLAALHSSLPFHSSNCIMLRACLHRGAVHNSLRRLATSSKARSPLPPSPRIRSKPKGMPAPKQSTPSPSAILYQRTKDRGPVSWTSLFLVTVAAASAVAYYRIEREKRLEAAMGQVVSSESDGWTPRPDYLAKRKFVPTQYGWFPMEDGFGARECLNCDLLLTSRVHSVLFCQREHSNTSFSIH